MKKKTIITIIFILILLAILVFGIIKTMEAINNSNNQEQTQSTENNSETNGQNMPSGMPGDNGNPPDGTPPDGNPPDGMPGGKPGDNSSSESVETKGATEVTEEKELTGEFISSNADESAILVSDGGNLTLDSVSVNKTGDTSNTENSEFYGVNSGILTTKNSTTTIKNATITTNAKGANAVFATGENAKVYITDATINTTGSSSSRGLDSTYGGYIEAQRVKISTEGGSCATLATDRGEGTVIAKDSNLSTKGAGSPIIYSTGDISIESTSGNAQGSQMVVVEGKNTATVNKSTLVCSGKGNRNEVDNCGIMIYQSMSGDAGEGTGTFNATESSLEIDTNSSYYKTAPFFFITNTNAVINIEKNTLKYGSNILLKAQGTSQWGNSGSNGGNVTLNAKTQELEGNIEVDNISSAVINLTEGSSLKGTINNENTAKNISIKLDSTSKLVLTGDSYVTSLDDEDSTYSNIEFNGYKLYVNGNAIN